MSRRKRKVSLSHLDMYDKNFMAESCLAALCEANG
jgi:hypothetical protein